MTVLTILKITTKICVFHKALSVLIQIDTYKRYNNCKLFKIIFSAEHCKRTCRLTKAIINM